MYTPRISRKPAIQGVAASASSELRTTAPRKANTAPGSASGSTSRQSTFPNRWWATPETAVVPTSARCTVAEAAAGAEPAASSSVVELTP